MEEDIVEQFKKLLPFSKRLEPDDPQVEKLPKAFKGSGKDIFNEEYFMNHGGK